MLSFKRFLYIVLMVAVLGGIFLIYTINEGRSAGSQIQSPSDLEREYIETNPVDEGDRPIVRLLGDSEDGRCGEIYSNVRQFCEDLHLSVIEEKYLDVSTARDRDLVIFCTDSIIRCADLKELEEFISDGGRVILAAGLGEGNEDSGLWTAFGIQEKSAGQDYHELVFDRPLLPVSPEQVYYDGNSNSARIKVDAEASVYIRDAENSVPVLYTYAWKKGSVCLINGTFLADVRYMGLLTGAISALLPDFVYPVLGVKAVFLDNFLTATSDNDELCRRVYGYSAEGFVRDVMWPVFQGISLRTDTPYTFGILVTASSEEDPGTTDDSLLTAIGRSALQFGGELAYAAAFPENEEVVFNRELIDLFSKTFTDYTVRGLVMETDSFSPDILDIPGADIQYVRKMPGNRNIRSFRKEGYTEFPAATKGNSMEDGNLFAIYSVLGAYGMISHVFDAGALIATDEGNAAWDLSKKQISLFESEVLAHASWLEGRTLTQTEGDVRSYQDLDYGWTKSDDRMEFHFSGAAKGQAFFYHTDNRISDAEGLTYLDVGNGYYLLRVQESTGSVKFE